jgi:hypothetical protein
MKSSVDISLKRLGVLDAADAATGFAVLIVLIGANLLYA